MKSTNIIQRMAFISLVAASLSVGSGVVVAQSGSHGARQGTNSVMPQKAAMKEVQPAKIGLSGYCPVCVISQSKWVMGVPEHAATFDGVTYYFPSAEVKGMFQLDPVAYVPALGGDCTVCYVNFGKRSPGTVQFASLNNKRLYLFPNDELRQEFNKAPEKFVDSDLAADGNCIVCSLNAGQPVKGSAEFTAVHDGMRYQFPSDRERQIFAASPAKFIAGDSQMMKNQNAMQGKTNQTLTSNSMIQIQGKTSCAACEFGVKPIHAPEELGMAVTTAQGKIFVIEESHTRWPKLYKDRYDGVRVAVSGNVIKTEGNISWIQPSAIKTY